MINLGFSSIISKYKAILENPHGFTFESSPDIRALFEDIISSEIDDKISPMELYSDETL